MLEEPLEGQTPAGAIGGSVPSEREVSTTVGTGSYVAISCTAIALLLTFAVLGLLFLIRWLQ